MQLNPRINVLAVIDGYRLTGPARQLFASSEYPGLSLSVAIFQRSPRPTPLIDAAREMRVPSYIIPDRFPGDPGTAVALARLAFGLAPQIFQTHGYKANVLAGLIAPLVRRPWVAFVHGETHENLRVRAYYALERRALRRADRVVVMSSHMAADLAARGVRAGALRVIHNASPAVADGDPPLAWSDDAPPLVGVVGRLSPEKGVDLALDAHRLVTRDVPDARLGIMGEGPERLRLIRAAESSGVASAVDWLGYLADPKPFYRRMAVLLIPSRSEGLPNVALEAMAHGVPVVAAAVGGLPEVISDGETGFLVAPGDAPAMAKHVAELLEDGTLRRRLGQAGQRDVRSRFSIEARCRALTQLYLEASA